ncbi:MAG: DUF5806 family protein [Methanocellales archaeon]|nr:DUF5806 family protein [Methanocellales archaeon]
MDEKYCKFKKFDKEQYAEVTRFLKERTHLTAREWAIALGYAQIFSVLEERR